MLIYFVTLYVIGIAGALFYAGQGGYFQSSGMCLFSGLWGALNLVLLLNFGFPEVF